MATYVTPWCSLCRYRLDADSPCAIRDRGQKDRRRQLERAVSQGNKAVVKVASSASASFHHCSTINDVTRTLLSSSLLQILLACIHGPLHFLKSWGETACLTVHTHRRHQEEF